MQSPGWMPSLLQDIAHLILQMPHLPFPPPLLSPSPMNIEDDLCLVKKANDARNQLEDLSDKVTVTAASILADSENFRIMF